MILKHYEQLSEAFSDFDADTNFKIPFDKLCKNYGKQYIDWCQTSWAANGGALTEDEFMKMNGGMTRKFFDNVVKPGADKIEVHEVSYVNP